MKRLFFLLGVALWSLAGCAWMSRGASVEVWVTNRSDSVSGGDWNLFQADNSDTVVAFTLGSAGSVAHGTADIDWGLYTSDTVWQSRINGDGMESGEFTLDPSWTAFGLEVTHDGDDIWHVTYPPTVVVVPEPNPVAVVLLGFVTGFVMFGSGWVMNLLRQMGRRSPEV